MTGLRDISAPPPEAPATTRRARRDIPFRPASRERPLLAAHGGEMRVEWLGLVSYGPTWELQEELAEQRRRGEAGDRLLLLEHRPVFTTGRGGDETNLIASRERLRALGAEFHRVDRGGDITFHGPGQIVAYPIVALHDPLDLRRYVRALEQAVIATVASFGLVADRVEGLPGVWVDDARKVAAVGVRVRRGVTTHGLALNVSTDLAWFDEMIPCGVRGMGVTTLSAEVGRHVAVGDVAPRLADELATALGARAGKGSWGPVGPAGASEE